MKKIHIDYAILGAGIAGLWLHYRLNHQGCQSLLIDINPIGSGQTLSAQGIIHGGTKYSLSGALSRSAEAISTMPKRWTDCIKGEGDVNLTNTKLLSDHQLMWSTKTLTGKLTTFLSNSVAHGRISTVSASNVPSYLLDKDSSSIYKLEEPVIDISSLLVDISSQYRDLIIQPKEYKIHRTSDGKVQLIIDEFILEPEQLFLTAGKGNRDILQQLNIKHISMQLRPLQMIFVKAPKLPKIFGHYIGASTKPLATVTSHNHKDGNTIWYIGGNIAEEGAKKDLKQLINDTKNLLSSAIASVDLTQAKWATHYIERAESKQIKLFRPDTVFIKSVNNIHICWPTKLALAPLLSDKIFEKINIQPSTNTNDTQELSSRYPAKISEPPWNRIVYDI